MFQRLFSFLFGISGWRVCGNLPSNHSKYIILVGPHTSYKDFLVGVGARNYLKFSPYFLIKKRFFGIPLLNNFLKHINAIGVENQGNNTLVEAISEEVKKRDNFILMLTPEGTRSKVKKIRSGFYHIARKSNIPIVCIGLDYPTKTLTISEPKHIILDFKKAIEYYTNYFADFVGKYPEKGINKI